MSIFQPGLESDHWRCSIPQLPFWQTSQSKAVEQTFMSKLRPDTPILKSSILFNQVLRLASMMRSPSNCKIPQPHLCQSLAGRSLRSALRWPRWAAVDYAQRINIIALGALARLPKALDRWCAVTMTLMGIRFITILKEVLFNSWQEVPAALTWATYDANHSMAGC
jgi:hypothetical protein